MLRSMLYVRKGSGCSRRVTASAAAPSAVKSCDSRSLRPSSGVSLSPATALSSSGAISEDKINSFIGQPQLDGQLIKQSQAAALGRTEMEMEVFGQIIDRPRCRNLQQRALANSNLPKTCNSSIARAAQHFVDVAQIGAA